jgi:hypothetical protein
MTDFSGNMLSIHVSGSIIGADDGTDIDISNRHSSYSHVIQADGGYWTANFSIDGNQQAVEDWIDRGLGRHVTVYNPGLQIVWEGFVDKITASLGRLSVTRGSLCDLANRVWADYAASDTGTSVSTIGVRDTTAASQDTASQTKYGIWECVLSGGSVPVVEVTAMQDTYLAENAWPVTSQELGGNVSNPGGKPSVRIECKGYAQLFNQYYYANASSGVDDLTVKLVDVIDYDPNGVLASTNADITTNTLSVAMYEDQDRMAWSVIKELVSAGDASDNRYTFGVYANRRIKYAPVPDELAYTERLHDPAQRVETLAGVWVKPWDVLPARWLFMPDFLVGRTPPQTRRFDPRYMFIESVTYTEPWGLQLRGGKFDTTAQRLARFGLQG